MHSLVSLHACFLLTLSPPPFSFFFFFNDTATTEIYTLSLHDALPICRRVSCRSTSSSLPTRLQNRGQNITRAPPSSPPRSPSRNRIFISWYIIAVVRLGSAATEAA